jgi:hypothetical protein
MHGERFDHLFLGQPQKAVPLFFWNTPQELATIMVNSSKSNIWFIFSLIIEF